MNDQEKEQIVNIISNFEEKSGYVPYISDLEKHPAFGPIFKSLSIEQKKIVQDLINRYILDKIDGFKKTKGGQLFKRFFENEQDLFWQFRVLNENADEDDVQFQSLGKRVEQEMFKLEGILTERMLNQEKGLDKVVGSFYNLVYMFFPKYNLIR